MRLRVSARRGDSRATATATMPGKCARLPINFVNRGTVDAECIGNGAPASIDRTFSHFYMQSADIDGDSCEYSSSVGLSAMADGDTVRSPDCESRVTDSDPGLILQGHCKICFAMGTVTYHR